MTLPAAPEYVSTAAEVGLRYVTDTTPGIRRQRRGRGFSYVAPDGSVLRDRAELARIRSLVIPPAWSDVWICPSDDGHLQVTARDAKGRKQYRYHPRFRERRDETKFARMIALSDVIQRIREEVERCIALPGLPREKVLATVVWLLERTLIRVGSTEYARENDSYGLTTLRRRHVRVRGDELRFEFRGKSGVAHAVSVTDRRIVRIVQQCHDLRGWELFKYVDDSGEKQTVEAEDVNDFLREVARRDVTAKDFRTWAGTMLAAEALRAQGPARTKKEAEKKVVQAVDDVAARLGNTRAVCRKYYIHPALLAAYLEGDVLPPQKARDAKREASSGATLRRHEAEVLAFLKRRLAN
jgi:DNA topoisomerase-1